nr:PREDICTED: mucin-13 [Apteryx mantelli mantelli]
MDCHKGLIFPGLITLQQSYSSSIELVNSTEYTEVFLNVTTFFTNAFRDETSFGQTVIVGIQLLQNSRSADTSMSITLMNLFAENSAVTNETVASKINKAAEDSKYITAYREPQSVRKLCIQNARAKVITQRQLGMTVLVQSVFFPSENADCNSECSVTSNKYCAKESGIPTCKCLTNFEMKDNRCVPCAVGYSGENCKNNSELNLIIVGTVLGAIILSFVIAAIFISARSKHKKDSERKSLIPAYLNSEDSGNTQTRMFPRVQTTSGYANPGYQSSNPYEMDRLSSSKALERDYNDEYETTQEPNGFRMQRRY